MRVSGDAHTGTDRGPVTHYSSRLTTGAVSRDDALPDPGAGPAGRLRTEVCPVTDGRLVPQPDLVPQCHVLAHVALIADSRTLADPAPLPNVRPRSEQGIRANHHPVIYAGQHAESRSLSDDGGLSQHGIVLSGGLVTHVGAWSCFDPSAERGLVSDLPAVLDLGERADPGAFPD